MGMSVSSARRKGVQPDMNVTPLVDVVLVLLIIFMVVTPQMDKNVPVDLPGIFHPDPESKNKMDPIEITIAKDGGFSIEKQTFDKDALVSELRRIHGQSPDRRVVLRGDQALEYLKVREIFALVKEIGFPGASLLVSELSGGKAKPVEGADGHVSQ